MTVYKGKYRVESTRLRGWDYGASAHYFVTICTKYRVHYFGQVKNGVMCLSDAGRVAEQELLKTAELRKNVTLDEWVIMPNHVHVIIRIMDEHDMDDTHIFLNERGTGIATRDKNESLHIHARGSGDGRDVARNVSTVAFPTSNGIRRVSPAPRIDIRHATPTEKNDWLSSISPKPKSLPSIIRGYKSAVTKQCSACNIDFAWQPRFHDRIIWNYESLHRARQYIKNNPDAWHRDRNNPPGLYM